MPDWSAITAELGISGEDPRPVSGGDISAAWRVGDVFVKTGPLSSCEMFSAEADGLAELAAPHAIRVPEVIACGTKDNTAYLAVEWLALSAPSRGVEKKLGERLAILHQTTADQYGWHRDNTIGLTPQHNTWCEDWLTFFREHRLGFQFELAAQNGYAGQLQDQGAQLLERLPVFFADHDPSPSLLHGDLWGGNWGNCEGEPVIFDPAVYYGDRESDLAMTRLFGGFGRAFYDTYEASAPLAPGHRQRSDLYQLYHVLNHLNLFGTAYLGRAQTLIQSLLRESK